MSPDELAFALETESLLWVEEHRQDLIRDSIHLQVSHLVCTAFRLLSENPLSLQETR